MISIFEEFVFDILVHHVESVFRVVFCPSWHLLDYLRPLVTDFDLLLQNEDVLLNRERLFLDLRIQEIDPSLPALLSITVLSFQLKLFAVKIVVVLLHQVVIEILCYLVPVLGPILLDNFDQLIVLFLTPYALFDAISPLLVVSIEALRIISPWNKS